ncbi:patatin-like phospholipase family protein [Ureibacillus chungkukjangi]|uniref:NTE family protein n=1 Tax=Ureibacillus chungkukjangi TaxID=1202712 RepID=A0A318TE97_9BACL|nr:patatin-like phospholipase family protein [Ureibacillus chungkukjangi]PYF03054.1 NTE family protein [Ureibacillus chungkukjangi]
MLIDGVFSGGGIKGFAYIGAMQVLEEKNYRFKRVAGTSAGAIMACFIAAGYTAKEIEKILDELHLKSLLDPPKPARTLPFLKWVNLYFRMGLYKGKALEKWFYKKLAAKGIITFNDLPRGSLKLIASDLTNGRMVVIPDDLASYGIDWRTFSVAKALRMSCGIPFFFEPIKLEDRSGECIFVDGGILSNFPLWIFENGNKQRPIIGMKLSNPREDMPPQKINNGLNLFEALFSTMKNAHDERYISRRHERNIVFIPVEKYSATQFDLDEETKVALIEIGRKRTAKFLEKWRPI